AAALVRPWEGAALACVALAGLAAAARWRRRVSWAACAAAVFAVLFAGVYGLLPAYNRHFAFRAGLHAHAEELDGGDAPRVACYPQRWDSASFYLPHADVRAYASGERGRLVDDLRARPDTLLLIKAGRALDELL